MKFNPRNSKYNILEVDMLQLGQSSFIGAQVEDKSYVIERDQERFHEEAWYLWPMWPHRVLLYRQWPGANGETELRFHVKSFVIFPSAIRQLGVLASQE